MVAPARLILATTNRGKLREVRAMLEEVPLLLQTLDDFPPVGAPIEDGGTFAENAALKAIHYAAALGGLVMADDSGLVVDALGGAPGVFSARFAGENATDEANNHKLITALADVPDDQRAARFCCSVALADRGGVVATASGQWAGMIVTPPRGANGFGYDPHFFVVDQACTAAELPPERKNRLSHRGRALRAIKPKMLELIAG